MSEEECPELGLTLQNHFRAIDVRMGRSKHSKHRQSLISLSRRHSMVQMLENLEIVSYISLLVFSFEFVLVFLLCDFYFILGWANTITTHFTE